MASLAAHTLGRAPDRGPEFVPCPYARNGEVRVPFLGTVRETAIRADRGHDVAPRQRAGALTLDVASECRKRRRCSRVDGDAEFLGHPSQSDEDLCILLARHRPLHGVIVKRGVHRHGLHRELFQNRPEDFR